MRRSRRRWVDPSDQVEGPALAAGYRRLLEASAAGGPIAAVPLDRLIAALHSTAALWARSHPASLRYATEPIIAKPRAARHAPPPRTSAATTPRAPPPGPPRRRLAAGPIADPPPPTASLASSTTAYAKGGSACPGTAAAASVEKADGMDRDWDSEPSLAAGPAATAVWETRLCDGVGAALWSQWAGPDGSLPALEVCWVEDAAVAQDDGSDGDGVLAC